MHYVSFQQFQLMPFGRRVKAAFKRRLLASKQQKRNRPRISGNWIPVSEETMALLNGINRPAHMIEKDMLVTGVESAQLRSLKSYLERRMNELRIEEMRVRELVYEEETCENETKNCMTIIEDTVDVN